MRHTPPAPRAEARTELSILDLLGQHILAVRADLATIKSDIGAIRSRLDHHQDELKVVSGLAMRATGERVAWSSVQAQLEKLTARIEALERQDR